jgi:hypothetical protein
MKIYKFSAVLVLGAVLLIASPVLAATTYNFVAHSPYGDPLYGDGYSGFTLQYVDADGDGRFSLDELVPGSFSGMTEQETSHSWYLCTDVLGLPAFSATQSPLTDGVQYYSKDSNTWWFYYPGDVPPTGAFGMGASNYSYSQSPVPIPASALLLGAGLIPLAWARRKKRLGK